MREAFDFAQPQLQAEWRVQAQRTSDSKRLPRKQQVTHHLICSEHNGWNSVVGLPDRLVQHSPESNMGSISQKDTTGGRKDKTVSDEEPLERNDGERDDREEEERQCVFTTCQTRVEVSKTWQL
jgi:hypothetical protein